MQSPAVKTRLALVSLKSEETIAQLARDLVAGQYLVPRMEQLAGTVPDTNLSHSALGFLRFSKDKLRARSYELWPTLIAFVVSQRTAADAGVHE